jgi:hypothetical protein
MTQLAFMLAAYALGLSFGVAYASGPRRVSLLCALAFPIGLALLGLTSLSLWFLELPFGATGVVACGAIIAAVATRRIVVQRIVERRDIGRLAAYSAVFAALATLCSLVPMAIPNYETHYLLAASRTVATDGFVDPQLWPVVIRASFPTAVHALGPAFGNELLHAVGPLLALSLVAVAVAAIGPALRAAGTPAWKTGLVLASLALAILTTFELGRMLVRGGSYGLASVYLFCGVTLLWRADRDGDSTLLRLAFVCLISAALSQAIMPLVVAVVVAVCVPRLCSSPRVVTGWLALFAVAIAVVLESFSAARSDEVLVHIAVVALGLLPFLYLAMTRFGVVRWVPPVVAIALAILVVVALATRFESFDAALLVIRATTVGSRDMSWGWVWSIVPILILLAWLAGGPRSSWFFAAGALALVLELVLSIYLAPNFGRTQLLHASHRLAQALPFLLCFVSLNLGTRALGTLAPDGASPASEATESELTRVEAISWAVGAIVVLLLASNLRLQAQNLRTLAPKYRLMIHVESPLEDVLKNKFEGADSTINDGTEAAGSGESGP